MLPRVDLPEPILEVVGWDPRFMEAFSSVSGGGTRLADLNVTVTAALSAQALNVRYKPFIYERVPALTRSRISHVDQNYMRPNVYLTFDGPLIEAQAGNAQAQAWGSGVITAADDGMRLLALRPSIATRANSRCFGRERDETRFNVISD